MSVREFTKRHQKFVSVVSVSEADYDWPPTNLLEFNDWLTEHVQQIPFRFQSSARIEINVTEHRSETCASISIGYLRPETDTEMEDRGQRERKWREESEQKELAMLAKLQEKYRDKLG